MDQRKRLIELQKDFHEHIEETCPRPHEISCDGCQYDLGDSCDWKAKLADHLLANGVVAVDVDAVSAPNRPLISQCLGHPLDEIIDLIRAKEEGRVIVPPVKVGDTVWIAGEYRGVYSAIVRTMFFSHSGVEMVRTTKCDIPFHDFGKVAFFTHEEAEKALAERSNR